MFNAWIRRHPIVQAKPGALEASGLNRRSRTLLPCAKIKIPARELLSPIFFFYYVSLRLQYYVLAAPLTGPAKLGGSLSWDACMQEKPLD